MQIDDMMIPRHLTVSDIADNDGEDLPNSLLDKISEEGNFDVFTKEDSIEKWDRLEKPRNTSPAINFPGEREIFEKGLRDGMLVKTGSSSSDKTIQVSPIERRQPSNINFVDLNMIGRDRALRRRDSSDEENNVAPQPGRQSNSNLIKIKEDSEEEDEAQSEGIIDELIIQKAINLTSSLYLKSDYKASPEQRSHPLKDRLADNCKNWARTQTTKLCVPLQTKPRLSATLASKQLIKRTAENPIHIDLGASTRQFTHEPVKKLVSSPRAATSKDKLSHTDQVLKQDLRSSHFTTVSNKHRLGSSQLQDSAQQTDISPSKASMPTRKSQHHNTGLTSIRNLTQPKNKELFCRRPFIEINKSKPAIKNSPRIPISAALNSKVHYPKQKDTAYSPEQNKTATEQKATDNVHTSLYDTQALSNSQGIAAPPLTVNTQSASSSRLSNTGFQLDKYSFNKSHHEIKSRLEKSTSSRGVASITAGYHGTGYDNLYEKRKLYASRVVNNHPLFLASCDRKNRADKNPPLDASKELQAPSAVASQSSCKSYRKASVRSCYSSTKKNTFARKGESNSPRQSESKPKFSHYFNMFQKDTLPTQSIYDRVTPEDEDHSSELFKEKNAIYAKRSANALRTSSSSREKYQATQPVIPINLGIQPRFGSVAIKASKEASPSLEQKEKKTKDSEEPR